MGYIGNQSAGITYTNINTFRGKLANLTALNAVSGMKNGDLYLTEDNNHAHMYTGTAWADLGEITGPQGLVGPVGPVGPVGMPGIINHIKRTVGTGAAGTTDTYTAYADAAETQILGTFNVYNGYDGVASTVGSLVDVDLITAPVKDGQTIVWNNVEGKWLPGDIVKLTGNQTIAGTKTFSSAIVGNITGNAATATKLATARTINGVAFDGRANITVSDSTAVKLTGDQTIAGVKTFSSTIVGSISGNSATATKLATAITIGGVSFDGTANINLPGVNAAGNQNTTGNSATATKLATARTINGVAFDGTANIVAPTNLGITAGTTAGPVVTSSTGTSATLPTASATASGVVTTGNQTIAGVKTFSSSPIIPTPTTDTQAANKAYVDSSAGGAWSANDTRAKTALNASGTAPIYACRAWVNFDGTGTVAIRASGNVSSITDNGVGSYTVNFTTAMPDANYSASMYTKPIIESVFEGIVSFIVTLRTSSIELAVASPAGGYKDATICCVSIFR